MKIKILVGRTIFYFSSKTSLFPGPGALFRTFLNNFLSFFLIIKEKEKKKKRKSTREEII